MTSPRSGPCFHLWNRALDIFAPGTGARRIQDRLRQTVEDRDNALVCNSELADENRYLRRTLLLVTGERNLFVAQDEMNTAIHETAFTSPSLLSSRNTAETLRLKVVN